MAQDVRLGSGAGADYEAKPPRWLAELKAKAALLRERCERPAGLAFGRWLGDFLDQDTPSGLLPAEEKLLFAAAKGEACILQSRPARLWAEFAAWRDRLPEAALPAEDGFAESMTRFLKAAPEAVQEVIHDATIHAMVELGLEDWEPKNAEEAKKLAQAQQAYFERLSMEANPPALVAAMKNDKAFYQLAVEAVIQALKPLPAGAAPHGTWLDLPHETQAKIAVQPHVLRDFFGDLARDMKNASGTDQSKLEADPEVLQANFDAVFQRYEREAWRWVDLHDPEVRLRASFLRFLSLGGDDVAPVHERRLEVHGAYIGEDLDLSGSTIPQPLLFFRSYFAGQILLRDAVTKSLDFQSSRLKSIVAESAQIHGSVFLRDGFHSGTKVKLNYAAIEGRLSWEGGTFLSGGSFAINCKGARIAGDVLLSYGFLGEGGVYFRGAKIGGDLNCMGGVLRNRTEDGSGVALGCDGAEISGDVVLIDGFRSEGSVSFSRAKIAGTLNCVAGKFVNQTEDGKGIALNLENAAVNARVLLQDGFTAEGQVRFFGAHVGGDFRCGGGQFCNLAWARLEATSTLTPRAATAINLQDAKIVGALWLGPFDTNSSAKANIAGSIKLHGCHAHGIVAHSNSWPSKKVAIKGGKAVPAFILIDGFTYDQMSGSSDHDAATRKKWLDRQPPNHLGVDFRPQPFEQLIKVYREMGHEGHAREIAKFKERRRRRANFIKLWHGWGSRPRYVAPLNWLAWPFAIARRAISRSLISVLYALEWFIVGFGTAYGYGYLRLFAFLIALWLTSGFFYASVANQGGFAPSNPVIYLNAELRDKCAKNWTDCKGAPPELPSFSPLTYSLDVMLPVLDFGQKHDWQPIDRTDRTVKVVLPALADLPGRDASDMPELMLGEGMLDTIVRAQTLLSWGALGLLALMLSGLIKRD